MIERRLGELERILMDAGRVYLHCSAGIHRTGMIAYALLLYMGHSREEAIGILRRLRDLAADGLSEERIAWSHRHFEGNDTDGRSGPA